MSHRIEVRWECDWCGAVVVREGVERDDDFPMPGGWEEVIVKHDYAGDICAECVAADNAGREQARERVIAERKAKRGA